MYYYDSNFRLCYRPMTIGKEILNSSKNDEEKLQIIIFIRL